MSAQAMHRVVLYGPGDPDLFRLLIVVADFADRDGQCAYVGQRLLAERVRVSIGRVRALLADAANDGWLTVDDPGGPRRRAVYNLGPALSEHPDRQQSARAARGARHENRADTRVPTHSKRAGTVTVVNVPPAPPAQSRAGGRRVGKNQSASAHAKSNKLTEDRRYRGLDNWTGTAGRDTNGSEP